MHSGADLNDAAVETMFKLTWPIATCACSLQAFAQAPPPTEFPSQLSESAPCVAQAAQYHGVNPWILRAILKVESNFDPRAVNRNANGSIDIGMAQINSIHFAELGRWGVLPANLMDGCVATYVAAWHLARQIRRHGNTWFGVASYHSTSPCQNERYAALVWNALAGWHVVAGPQLRVRSLKGCGKANEPSLIGRPSPPKSRTTASGSPAIVFDAGP